MPLLAIVIVAGVVIWLQITRLPYRSSCCLEEYRNTEAQADADHTDLLRQNTGMRQLLARRGIQLCPECCNTFLLPENFCLRCSGTGEISTTYRG